MKNGVPLTAEQIQEQNAYIQRARLKKAARDREAEARRLKDAQLKIFQAQIRSWEFRRSRGQNAPPPFPMTPVSQASGTQTSEPDRSNPFAAGPVESAPETSPAPGGNTTIAYGAGGVGLTRSAIQSFFERPQLGRFIFSYSTHVRGMPRTSGDLPNDNDEAKVEVIGPDNRVQSVSVMVGMPNDDNRMVNRNYARMQALLGLILPGWGSGATWLNAQVPNILRSGQEVRASVLGLQVSLVGGGPLPVLVLTVEVG